MVVGKSMVYIVNEILVSLGIRGNVDISYNIDEILGIGYWKKKVK